LPALQSLIAAVLLFRMNRQAGFAALLFWPWVLLTPRLLTRHTAAAAGDLNEEEEPAPDPMPTPPDLMDDSVALQPLIRAFALQPMFTAPFRKRALGLGRVTGHTHFVRAWAER